MINAQIGMLIKGEYIVHRHIGKRGVAGAWRSKIA